MIVEYRSKTNNKKRFLLVLILYQRINTPFFVLLSDEIIIKHYLKSTKNTINLYFVAKQGKKCIKK